MYLHNYVIITTFVCIVEPTLKSDFYTIDYVNIGNKQIKKSIIIY